MHKIFVVLAAFAVVFSASVVHAEETQPFDAAADCKAQPWGETKKLRPGYDPDDLMPELKASNEPEYVPAELLKDLFMQFAQPVLGAHAEEMIAAMGGICVSKQNHTLHATFYFREPYALVLKPLSEAWKMETYEAHFPKLLRIKVEKWGDWVEAYLSGRFLNTLRLKTRVAVISDWVYLHHLSINTKTKWMRIGAGSMHDRIKVVAWSLFQPGGRILSKISASATFTQQFKRGW